MDPALSQPADADAFGDRIEPTAADATTQRARHQSNRLAWNEAADYYRRQAAETRQLIAAGGSSLHPIERQNLARRGPLAQWCRRAIHLQCAGGRDTLSLLNEGAATVVGIDIADAMIAQAQAVSDDLGLPARWYCCDVLDAPAQLDGSADLVYTGRGALCWLHDIAGWARVVARLLRTDGVLSLYDGHPMQWLFDPDADRLLPATGTRYFNYAMSTAGWPDTYIGTVPGVERGHELRKYERNWTLAQVVQALIDAGLRIEFFGEHVEDFWQSMPHLPPAERGRIANTFSILARKPAAVVAGAGSVVGYPPPEAATVSGASAAAVVVAAGASAGGDSVAAAPAASAEGDTGAAAPLGTVKQSAAWWCFVPGKLSPAEFLAAVRHIGYDAVELVPKEFWPLVRDHGLAIAAIGGHASIEAGLNDRAQVDRIRREVDAALEDAVKWRIPNLICFSGGRRGTGANNEYSIDDAVGAEITAETLSLLAPAARDAGVTLVLELLNSKRDHRGYQCDSTDWGARVVDAVGSPYVKLLYDIYHMQIMEGDIIATITANHQRIGHIHTAGNPGRHELNRQQEINYPPVFRTIARDCGYRGYIGHEFVPVGDPLESLAAAYALVREALQP